MKPVSEPSIWSILMNVSHALKKCILYLLWVVFYKYQLGQYGCSLIFEYPSSATSSTLAQTLFPLFLCSAQFIFYSLLGK